LLEKHLKAVERQADHCTKVIALLVKTSEQYNKEPLADGSAPEKEKGAGVAAKKRRERLQLFLRLETAEEEMAS
jgi:hypothetical protein